MFQIVHTARKESSEMSAEQAVNKVLWLFDLDHTLICPKVGQFARHENDYNYLRTIITNDPIDIIIYSNQLRTHNGFMNKVTKICAEISNQCPRANIHFFAAFQDDYFRKPCSKGLIDNFDLSKYDVKIFVGDAAGRENDFSDTDYKFAVNIGAYFLVPEAYDQFYAKSLKKTAKGIAWFSDPKAIKKFVRRSEKRCPEQIESAVYYVDWSQYSRTNNIERYQAILLPLLNKRVIMCGRQGSGKSTFAAVAKSMKMNVYDYGSCRKPFRGDLIDGTYADPANRPDVDAIIYMDTPADVCKHNRRYRELIHGITKVPEVAIRIFEKKFVAPTGPNVITVPFMVDSNADPDYFKYYY